MNITYLISDKYIASAELRESYAVDSIAYFCPTCGDVWGRIVAGAYWQLLTVPCEQHVPACVASWYKIPGSILIPMERKDAVGRWGWGAVLEVLPAAVLQRELLIHINHVERNYHESDGQ